MRENAHIGLLFVDFFRDVIGLHVNGAAQLIEHDQLLADARATVRILRELEQTGGRRPERWVQVSVHEAYVHCSKHIPLLAKLDKRIHWGTDDFKRKGGDFFGVARDRAAAQGRESAAAPACEGAAARALDLPAQRSSSKVHETTSSGP